MYRVYFDMGVFTYWSEESLESRRLISRGGVLVSDEAALQSVNDGTEPIDPDIIELLNNLLRDGFELNVCDSCTTAELKKKLSLYGIDSMFTTVMGSKSPNALSGKISKVRGREDFSMFVGSNDLMIEAADLCQMPVIAYGENMSEIERDPFCWALYPLEVEDQIHTCIVIHEVAKRVIEKNARILGIDGIEFAGKKFFTAKLGRYFDLLGKDYDVVDLEDYHRAVEQSYKGENPVESYYFNGFNYDKLISEVLKPFSKAGEIDKVVYCLDSGNDSFVNERHYKLSQEGVLILIGTMMYREPLLRYFDATVYMRVDYRESEHRASLQDTPVYGDDPVEVYKSKQIPAQKMYIQRHDPFDGRDFVIDNSNYHRPFFIN